MTVQMVGARRLSVLMRAERLRDLDSSWLLFGPEPDEAEEETAGLEPWKIAAE
jgi:hypothetical protein